MKNLMREIGCVWPLTRTAVVLAGGSGIWDILKKKRKILLIMEIVGGFLCVRECNAYTTVTLSTAAPAGLEKKFIAQTTTQFQASLIVNPLASNTYAIKLFDVGAPPTVVGNSLNECIAEGFTGGMDSERWTTTQLIKKLQNDDATNGTCSGIVVSSTSAQDCQYVYNRIGSIIAQRWLMVFSSTGAVVQ